MTQEDKELLLKDLCARLPYGVKCNINFNQKDGTLTTELLQGVMTDSISVKPYLRPMSSMTEEEKLMYEGLMIGIGNVSYMLDVIDWLNAHHFDYRGLIEKDLALVAPKNMYNNLK